MEGTMEIIPYPWDDDPYPAPVEQNQQVTESGKHGTPQTQSKSAEVMAPTVRPTRRDVVTTTENHLRRVPVQWKMTNNIKIPGNKNIKSIQWTKVPTRCNAVIKQQQTKGTNKVRDNIVPFIICLVVVVALLILFIYYMINYFFNQQNS